MPEDTPEAIAELSVDWIGRPGQPQTRKAAPFGAAQHGLGESRLQASV